MAELRPLRRRTAVPTVTALAEARRLPAVDATRLRVDVDLVLDQDLDR